MKKIYLLAVLISVFYALTILDFSFISGQSAHWKNLYADIITNIIGALYFAQDSWRWPLFYVPHLAFPEGTTIIYTDSIPLFALIAKIIFKITGEWYNYFGFWIFLCFPLLAFFTALAEKECNFKNSAAIPFAVTGAVLLALSCPALLVRFGHAALMAHFLLLWAFYLYLKFNRTSSLKNLTLQFAILTALTILLQTYFLLMIIPFYIGALLQALKEQKVSWSQAVLSIIVVISSIILLAFITGIIGPNTPRATMFGFGYYSMNILSPFLPSRAHLPNFLAQHIHWDSNGYTWDATGGQYEGYNYLGAGLFILILVHLPHAITLVKYIFKHHLFLFLGLSTLCLLALSNNVYLADKLIIHVSIHDHWFSYFRTSARLFWPIYYVLVVALVAATFERFSLKTAILIVAIAVIAQLMDTHILRVNMEKAARAVFPQVLPHNIWIPLIAAHEFIEQYPSYQCGGWANGRWPDNNSNMEMLLLAAKQNKPINSAYLARTSRDCFEENIHAARIDIKPGGLYIFKKNFSNQEKIITLKNFKKICREFKFAYICSTQLATFPNLVPSPEFTIPNKIHLPTYQLGETLHFITDGNGLPFLFRGWYDPEPWGTWTMGTDSDILLKIVNPSSNGYLLSVYARGFISPIHPIKKVDIYINGKKMATWEYRKGEELIQHTIEIPSIFVQKTNILNINFHSDEIDSPKEIGFSNDHRHISLGLVSLIIKDNVE